MGKIRDLNDDTLMVLEEYARQQAKTDLKKEVDGLPDSSFALVFEKDGGKKRRFPIRDKNGKPDEARIEYAKSRLSQSNLTEDQKKLAEVEIDKAAKEAEIMAGVKDMADENSQDFVAELRAALAEFSKDGKEGKKMAEVFEDKLKQLEDAEALRAAEFETKQKELEAKLEAEEKAKTELSKQANERVLALEKRIEETEAKLSAEIQAKEIENRRLQVEAFLSDELSEYAYDGQLDVARLYLTQPGSGEPLFDIPKVDDEGKAVLDDEGNPVIEKHTVLDFAREYSRAIPEDMKPKAVLDDSTSFSKPEPKEDDDIKRSKELMRRGAELMAKRHGTSLEALVKEGKIQVVEPEK